MRLAIIGNRNFTDEARFEKCVAEALATWECERPDKIVSGGARGADSLAEQWARRNGFAEEDIIVHAANWKRDGKAAGIIRNYDIVRDATHFLAFPSRSGRGTQHTIGVAQGKGKPVIVHYID
jgi:hypothetical protein